ncbi:hypothetical protein MVEN_00270900 [Mycena venus]|uniref:Nephrocystin 3-like N-terminal domain-containing protein n=1 Tax=Mycena venus TaxID=2733690 RepID=A0A8H7DDY1_9AGAR|nr:hypothetical protein MVEN_00270900 [Mycena venus]
MLCRGNEPHTINNYISGGVGGAGGAGSAEGQGGGGGTGEGPELSYVIDAIENLTMNNSITGNFTQIFASHGKRMTGEARDTGKVGYGNSHSIQPVADGQSAGATQRQRGVPQHHNRPYGIVDRRHHNVLEESQSHPFIAWPPFPNSEGVPANSYRVGGNMTQLQVTSYGESGLDILYRFIAMGATHDSGERFAEPACHPGTRVAVLEQLSAWADDTRPESSILWLHGSAGMGKSAVAQMFAGNCKTSGRLGASFFFKRGDPEQGSWHRLFSTLAYQLAHSVPELLLHVQHAVETNKLVINQMKELQFQRLIVEPLKQVPVPQLLPILVLDGLDECEDPKIQQDILQLFIDAIHVRQLPIHILIASRPEPHIRGVLQTKATLNICRLMELSADKTAYEDIQTYLRNEFSRIRSEYFTEGIDLGEAWPGQEATEHLVKKSCGLFVYATTVVRFVGNPYSHPQERLNSVLDLDPKSTVPLDDLYSQILSVVERNERQLRILHVIWQMTLESPRLAPDPEEIDLILDLSRGTSRLALRRLHSLLELPPIRTRGSLHRRVNVLHSAFTDYLGDVRRSNGWCVSLPWLHSDYLHCMIRLLSLPPSTYSRRGLYCAILEVLPKLLATATPCDKLFALLRNPNFQDSFFLSAQQGFRGWPQADSLYPSDLIKLWECHQFISNVAWNLNVSGKECVPSFKYDSLYREILSGRPTLVFVLSVELLLPGEVASVLRLFDLTYRIFEPLLAFRDYPYLLSFELGDSPVDFIADPQRAGAMFSDLQDIAEVLVLRWISRAREVILGGDFWLNPNFLVIIGRCRPSSKILHELASLDLSELCDHMSGDQDAHEYLHDGITSEGILIGVVNWLQTFSETPLKIIEFWEKQIAQIRQCIRTLEAGADFIAGE